MSQVRVHNFSISIDGFGTGDGLTLDAPFGHAGERLHEWMFATRFWRAMVGETGGEMGVDHAFAHQNLLNIGAEEIKGAQLVTLPACGHMLMVEQPDATLDALVAFLAKRATGN